MIRDWHKNDASLRERVSLRDADESDCLFIYGMANEPYTRRWCHNKEHIPFARHQRNYANWLAIGTPIYMLEADGKRLGYTRFAALEGMWRPELAEASIGVALKPPYRKRGLGSILLKLSCQKAFEQNENLRTIWADVHGQNIGSQKLFTDCGFNRHEPNLTGEYLSFYLKKSD